MYLFHRTDEYPPFLCGVLGITIYTALYMPGPRLLLCSAITPLRVCSEPSAGTTLQRGKSNSCLYVCFLCCGPHLAESSA